MKFDTLIIGGGLAGLLCGIRLAEAGQRCAIVSQGQSALHFSSGSFDLFGFRPDGTPAENPLAEVAALKRSNPQHPYALLGVKACERYARLAPKLLGEAGIRVSGSCDRNHFRFSPMGKAIPTWLTMDGYLTVAEPGKFPFARVAIVNIEGFLDFYPEFIAEEFRHFGIACRFGAVNSPALEKIRMNPSEMRSANIARLFDHESEIDRLAALVRKTAAACDAAMLPAIVGINRPEAFEALREKVGRPVYLLATMPPSVPGIRAQQLLQRRFRALGGEYFLGDAVVAARFESEGCRVGSVTTVNHGNIPFRADNFVLASGSFFSRGLVATPDRIVEPIFGLDTRFAPRRADWYGERFFEPQAYQAFGLSVDRRFHALSRGKAIDNLFCIGAGLAGFHPIQEGSGAGVSILTALQVADTILSRRKA